ncbi:MAG TPA: DUF1553 domain-containing protein, partial [Pirellulales bacterium]
SYDLKWLHREIARSRTYQLSWKPNETNGLDQRDFSHALVRRLPAEVAYDAISMATAGKDELAAALDKPEQRTIGLGNQPGGKGKAGAGRYALAVFGKPLRLTNCDCERNAAPSLLQTIFLRNDQETLSMIDRESGWLRETGKEFGPAFTRAEPFKVERNSFRSETSDKSPGAGADSRSADRIEPLIREAFLRTLSRPPSDAELADGRKTFEESDSPSSAMRSLFWALLNTKEFIVNH